MRETLGLRSRFYIATGLLLLTVITAGFGIIFYLNQVKLAHHELDSARTSLNRVLQLAATTDKLALLAKDMQFDSQSEDFKGLEKDRFDSLLKLKSEIENQIKALAESSAKIGSVAQNSAVSDSLGIMYRNIETLAGALRQKRVSGEDSLRFYLAINANRAETLTILAPFQAKSQEQVNSSLAKVAVTLAQLTQSLIAGLSAVGIAILGFALFYARKNLLLLTKSREFFSLVTTDILQSIKSISQNSKDFRGHASKAAFLLNENAKIINQQTSERDIFEGKRSLVSKALENLKINYETIAGERPHVDQIKVTQSSIQECIQRVKEMTSIIQDYAERIQEFSLRCKLISVNTSIASTRLQSDDNTLTSLADDMQSLADLAQSLGQALFKQTHEPSQSISTKLQSCSFTLEQNQAQQTLVIKQFNALQNSLSELSAIIRTLETGLQQNELDQQSMQSNLLYVRDLCTQIDQSIMHHDTTVTLLRKQCELLTDESHKIEAFIANDPSPAQGTPETAVILAERMNTQNSVNEDPDIGKIIAINHPQPLPEVIEDPEDAQQVSLKSTGTER
jgi:hypothetical protein